MGIFGFLRKLGPISGNDEYCLSLLRDDEEHEIVKKLVRNKVLGFELRTFGLTIFDKHIDSLGKLVKFLGSGNA